MIEASNWTMIEAIPEVACRSVHSDLAPNRCCVSGTAEACPWDPSSTYAMGPLCGNHEAKSTIGICLLKKGLGREQVLVRCTCGDVLCFQCILHLMPDTCLFTSSQTSIVRNLDACKTHLQQYSWWQKRKRHWRQLQYIVHPAGMRDGIEPTLHIPPKNEADRSWCGPFRRPDFTGPRPAKAPRRLKFCCCHSTKHLTVPASFLRI